MLVDQYRQHSFAHRSIGVWKKNFHQILENLYTADDIQKNLEDVSKETEVTHKTYSGVVSQGNKIVNIVWKLL